MQGRLILFGRFVAGFSLNTGLIPGAPPPAPDDWQLVLATGDPQTLRPYRAAYLNDQVTARDGPVPPYFDRSAFNGEITVGEAPCGGRAILLRRQPGPDPFLFAIGPRVSNSRSLQLQAGRNDRFRVEFEYDIPSNFVAKFIVVSRNHSTPLVIESESSQGSPATWNSADAMTTALQFSNAAHWTPYRADVTAIHEPCEIFFGRGLSTSASNSLAAIRSIRVYHTTE